MSRTLIIAPQWLGDSLMAQPLVMRLKAKAPQHAIDVLALPAIAPVWRRTPGIDEVIEADFRHGELGLKARFKLGRALKGRYAHAFVLPNSFKAALLPFFADIPLRIGYLGESRVGLINVRHANPKKNAKRAPMTDFYAQLSEAPGKPLPGPLTRPRLIADPLRAIAAKATLGFKPAEPIVVLAPGAEYGPAKRWPAEYFAEVASKLKARDITPIVLGGPKDVPVALMIEQLSHGAALNLAGKTSLDEAIDLIHSARAVLTNDSGLMHIAAALDRPQLALFGSSSPEHTPPLSEAAQVMSLKLQCSPCYARECPLKHFDCMQQMKPASVLEAFDKLIA